MKIITIKSKEIFICEHHNEVIEFWAKFKETKPNIISFDHHTDTKRAFQKLWRTQKLITNEHLLERLKNGDFELVKSLKNDEHIDASVLCDLVDKVLLITYTQSGKNDNLIDVNDFQDYNNHRIIVNQHLKMPEMSIDSEILEEQFKRFELCISPKYWRSNYILDIDLDFFYKTDSINVKDNSFFKNLIKNAKAISIARERQFVNGWKRDFDNNLSVEFLEEKLIELIKESN